MMLGPPLTFRDALSQEEAYLRGPWPCGLRRCEPEKGWFFRARKKRALHAFSISEPVLCIASTRDAVEVQGFARDRPKKTCLRVQRHGPKILSILGLRAKDCQEVRSVTTTRLVFSRLFNILFSFIIFWAGLIHITGVFGGPGDGWPGTVRWPAQDRDQSPILTHSQSRMSRMSRWNV